MGGDLREQLAAINPACAHQLLFHAKGRKHAGYNELGVIETLAKFVADILPASPFISPHGKRVSVVKGNFPKLAGIVHGTLGRGEYSATQIVTAIEAGNFDLGDYDPVRDDRIRTLFWLPELFRDPDAIYQNAHKIVAGNEVYVSVYDKMGSKVKLAFTQDLKRDGTIIRTVPITSFLTDAATALSYVKGQPIYRKQ